MLEELHLLQCADLEELCLLDGTREAPSLQSLFINKLSRVSKLHSVKLALPSLTHLSLPEPLTSVRPGLRRLVLACPKLNDLDLSTLRWIQLVECRVASDDLTTLNPPKACSLAEELLDPEDEAETAETKGTVLNIEAPRLQLLDLRGAHRLVDITVSLAAKGARVLWPRRCSAAWPVKLVLTLHEGTDALPPPSPLDEAISCFEVVMPMEPPRPCTRRPELSALASTVARWPCLATLDLGGLSEGLTNRELLALVRAAPPSLRLLRCGKCSRLTPGGVSSAQLAAANARLAAATPQGFNVPLCIEAELSPAAAIASVEAHPLPRHEQATSEASLAPVVTSAAAEGTASVMEVGASATGRSAADAVSTEATAGGDDTVSGGPFELTDHPQVTVEPAPLLPRHPPQRPPAGYWAIAIAATTPLRQAVTLLTGTTGLVSSVEVAVAAVTCGAFLRGCGFAALRWWQRWHMPRR
eukprot:TRINITY_DN44697_c0_g1_i1.p1 TRINITY_DN44697_c0_g1~~TRINITY_DN44697_c0_g1_i1.p1  ORF type:complete len:528 (-),score=61.10 TRINITY_DN44697_c0_g1_i1:14-1426(-)